MKCCLSGRSVLQLFPHQQKKKGKKNQGLSAQDHMLKTVQIETNVTKKISETALK